MESIYYHEYCFSLSHDWERDGVRVEKLSFCTEIQCNTTASPFTPHPNVLPSRGEGICETAMTRYS
jgi:hypothetical protein